MKRFVRLAAVILSAAMLTGLAACGDAPAKAEEKSLYDHGLEMIALLDEMAGSEEYLSLFSSSEELTAILTEAANGDFSKPQAVYKLSGGGDRVMYMSDEIEAFNALSDTLKENVRSRLFSALVTKINAQAGSMVLAASSICTAGKTFVSSELTENMTYIYVFENAVPAAVTFTMGEDGAVSASAAFILHDGIDISVEGLSGFLGEFGLKLEEVELK